VFSVQTLSLWYLHSYMHH